MLVKAAVRSSIFSSNVVFWSFMAVSMSVSFLPISIDCSFMVASMAPSLTSSVLFTSDRMPCTSSIFLPTAMV